VGELREHTSIVLASTLHHDKMEKGEVEIFQDTVSLRVDGKGLKRTQILTLQLNCKDAVPVNEAFQGLPVWDCDIWG
jgi:hypothetical protein